MIYRVKVTQVKSWQFYVEADNEVEAKNMAHEPSEGELGEVAWADETRTVAEPTNKPEGWLYSSGDGWIPPSQAIARYIDAETARQQEVERQGQQDEDAMRQADEGYAELHRGSRW